MSNTSVAKIEISICHWISKKLKVKQKNGFVHQKLIHIWFSFQKETNQPVLFWFSFYIKKIEWLAFF